MLSKLELHQAELQADTFCIAAHSAIGQIRKGTAEPYWYHPRRVAALVKRYYHDDIDLIQAAYLHDVVEDTKVTLGLIQYVFNKEVSKIVEGVTNVSAKAGGHRESRKKMDRDHVANNTNWKVKALKIADVIDNIQDVFDMDPQFARVYIPEKRLLLNAIYSEEVSAIWNHAYEVLVANEKKIANYWNK